MPDTPDAVIVTADPVILDELLRLCAVAGSRAGVVGDAGALERAWTQPATVLLGADLAALAYERPPRAELVVVGTAARPPWEAAARLGAGRVAELPAASPWLLEHLRAGPDGAGGTAEAAAPVVCVIGGHGGAGASTLAAAVARTAAARVPRGRSPVLAVDADALGPGLDLTLGLETAGGSRWSSVLAAGASSGVPEQLLEALPGRTGLRLLAVDADCPPRLPVDAVRAAITVGARSAALVVVDLGAADPALCSAVLPHARLVCLVTGANGRMVAAARRRLAGIPLPAERSVLVVRGPAPGAMAPIGVGQALQLPVFGVLGNEPGLDRDYARGAPPGRPRGPLARLSAALLDRLELPAGARRAAA